MSLPVESRLFGPGPKRVLALDGGGTRGIITIAFLIEMERQLREATGRKDLVLADVFDMIAGTSVGSMLATMLALGRDMKFVDDKFRELAPKIFAGRETLFGQKRFDARPLVNGVRSIVADERLGSEKLLTGLTIIAKRVDKGSVWVVSNNPRMPFYEDGPDWDGNKRYKLESLVRASTAAPFLFSPAQMLIHTDRNGKETYGDFVDGGVSPHNNPSYQLLLMAGLPAYRLNWKLTPKDLLIISVGTGLHRTLIDPKKRVIKGLGGAAFGMLAKDLREDIEEAAFAASALRGMVSDASMLVLKSMQALSHPRFSWKINGEVNALEKEILGRVEGDILTETDADGLMRFQRYDLPLELGGLVKAEFDLPTSVTAAELATLHAIDDPSKMTRLSVLAKDVARRQVSIKDFEGFI